MRKGEKKFFLRKGMHLLEFLLVALMTGSLIFSSCAGCSSSNNGNPPPKKTTPAELCETSLKTSSASNTVSATNFNAIIANCFSNQNDKNVAAVIQKYPVVYNYTVLLYDVKKFVEDGLNGLGQLLSMVKTPAAFKSEATPSGDLTALLKSMLMSKLLPYMEDASKRVATLAQMDMDSVSVYFESVPVKFNISNFLTNSNLKNVNIPTQLDLKGEWDYPEVLVIGALNDGIFAGWKMIESQTLGTLQNDLAIFQSYKIKMNLDNPFELTNLVATIAGKVPAILAFEPTEGKKIFKDTVRLYLDGVLSYLTGREDNLESNGTTYAVKNPGLFAAIENMYSKDQSRGVVQFIDKDGDKQISFGDQIVIPLLENIKKGLGTITSPIHRKTWLDLINFGKEIENQLENYESATANLDAGKMLNEVFADFVSYATEVSPDIKINLPKIPENFLMINAGALFKAVDSESSFKGLRSLFPAWVPNPRASDSTKVPGRLDLDENGKPFEYILVFETEVSSSTGYKAVGPLSYNKTLYYGLYAPATTDPAHFDLFFDQNGDPNTLFFGSVDPSAGDGAADLENLHSIIPDGLVPNSVHDTLLYLGLQQPTFYGLISVDPSGFAKIPGCDNDALVNSKDPQLIVNGVVNCAILQFGTPISELYTILSKTLIGASL